MSKTGLTSKEIAAGIAARKSMHYECKMCSTRIPANTGGVFTRCECGEIAVDGTEFYSRLIGKKEMFLTRYGEIPSTYVYRIKQVSTGKFFNPRRGYIGAHFSDTGKFYGRKPSLRWVADHHGKCVIEKYIIKKVKL